MVYLTNISIFNDQGLRRENKAMRQDISHSQATKALVAERAIIAQLQVKYSCFVVVNLLMLNAVHCMDVYFIYVSFTILFAFSFGFL